VVADLGDLAQAAALVARSEQAIGPLDVLVNNAGVEVAAAYPAFADEELEAVVRVNLRAPMVLTRHALAGMLARGRGHIVTVSSLAARAASPTTPLTRRRRRALAG